MSDLETMDDYLNGSEPDPPDADVNVPDDHHPYTCDQCGQSFEGFGVRASKVLRKHEQRCNGRDSQ